MPNPSLDLTPLCAPAVHKLPRHNTYPVLAPGWRPSGGDCSWRAVKTSDLQWRQARAWCRPSHPDDETLGCGAMIRGKLTAKTAVEIVIATAGRHSHRSGQLSIDADPRGLRH